MSLSPEAIWASIVSVVSGVTLLLAGRLISKPDRAAAAAEKAREQAMANADSFHKSVQEELHDVRDEVSRTREEADKYRTMYYEALDNLHEGGSVREVLETLNSIDARAARTELLLAQHLRDGVYLLEQGAAHDQAVIDAFARLNIELPHVDYQTDKALGAKELLDRLEAEDEQQGNG